MRTFRSTCSHLSVEALEDRLVPSGGPLTVGGDPRVHPADFQITTFATGLDYPYGMVRLADGSLLVTETSSASGNYFNSDGGELVRLTDADGDGVADGPGTVLYNGLPGSVSALRQAGNLFFVTSSQSGAQRISVLRAGATPASPLTLVGSVNFAFPANWEHASYETAIRPTPGRPGDFDLFFNIGAGGNTDSPPGPIPVSGLVGGSLNVNSIFKVTVHDTGGTPVLSNLTQVATGLRNAAGMAFDPVTGDLYLEDNGADGADGEELSTDELNVICAADIGRTVKDFGFPNAYTDYATGNQVGSGGTAPLVTFSPAQMKPAGAELAGATQVAFVPKSFPASLKDGVFVGFHGDLNDGGAANDENPLVYVDLRTRHYFEFVSSSLPGIGHLDGLLATNDALFLTDMSSTGDVFGSHRTGVVYEIKALARAPKPPVVAGFHGHSAGVTQFDQDLNALDAVLREWSHQTATYTQKVADLSNASSPNFTKRLNGDVFLTASGPNATVHSNGGGNKLLATRGRNWYFARLAGSGKKDTLQGNRPDEAVVFIEPEV